MIKKEKENLRRYCRKTPLAKSYIVRVFLNIFSSRKKNINQNP